MAWQLSGEAGGGKGRCVGSLGSPTMGHLRLTIGYLKATVVHIRVTLGHLKVTVGHLRLTISKHKANTTELHPKVRQTCFHIKWQLNKIDTRAGSRQTLYVMYQQNYY